MSNVSELVLPKLGLTMTEGSIAQWMAAPGQRFAAGDIIVVIETDKIASDVEAPAAGTLLEILHPEGAVLPVGTPIARWQPDEATTPAQSPPEAPPAVAPPSADPVAPRSSQDKPSLPTPRNGRVTATPYARKLAREAHLDITHVEGTGPGRRIKAADVVRTLQSRPDEQISTLAAPALETRQVGAPSVGLRAFSLATTDISVDELRQIENRLGTAGSTRRYERLDYVVLAMLKTGHGIGTNSRAPDIVIGIEQEGRSFLAHLDGPARPTLSSVASAIDALSNSAPKSDNASGEIAILPSQADIHLFAPYAAGFPMTLGIGSVRPQEGSAGLQNSAVSSHVMSLALSYNSEIVSHQAAQTLLRALKAMLEEPLSMLAM